MGKYIVTGKMVVDVTAEVEAESQSDAESQLDTADCCVESSDETITFTDCCQAGFECESVVCVAEEAWDSMDKLGRMSLLVENGVSDDSAYDCANMDFNDLPDEWKGYLDD